jgi:uncharacterized membrane protein YeaQ/YmgE (transglycosylase-associated protein family)
MLLLGIIVFGLAIGFVAQLILGHSMSDIDWPMALGSGLLGSFVGGLIVSLLSGDGLSLRASGIIGSIVGAVLVTFAWSWFKGRSTQPS